MAKRLTYTQIINSIIGKSLITWV